MNKTTGKVQAKDISDDDAIRAVRNVAQPWGTAHLWDVQNELGEFPPKVVLAKLRALIRRGIIDGCDCGCRGDFKVLD